MSRENLYKVNGIYPTFTRHHLKTYKRPLFPCLGETLFGSDFQLLQRPIFFSSLRLFTNVVHMFRSDRGSISSKSITDITQYGSNPLIIVSLHRRHDVGITFTINRP